MLNKILEIILGSKNERDIKKLKPLVKKVNSFEPSIQQLTNEQLRAKTDEFRGRLKKGETLDDIMPEAFAVVREAAKRTLGMRHFDVQVMGAIVLHQGKIAEMKTGEGKTLVATMPLYLNALTGKGVHLVTVNDYLAKRDAVWMGPIYKLLGLEVGVINQQGVSYRVEWENPELAEKAIKENLKALSNYTQDEIPPKDLVNEEVIKMFAVKPVECFRKDAYTADITYGTNNEFGFDYLRDNMVMDFSHKVQRGHHYAIVDEVDSILIDEARTPLIISGPADESTELYYKIDRIVPRLKEVTEKNEKGEPLEDTGDYVVDEKNKNVFLTERGLKRVEELLKTERIIKRDLFEKPELIHYVTQAIRAHKLYLRDRDYIVKDGEVIIVDEFTGRLMYGRRWSDGLHQAVEAKERVPIRREFQTLATITFQNYFRMYEKLAGMTGTAETEAEEFWKIYKLDVVVIPTHKPVIRIDHPDRVYKNEKIKFKAIVEEVVRLHKKGQPVLIGTVSVEKSERLSKMLKRAGIPHNVLNAKYHEKEAMIIAEAGRKGAVTVATNMAGRGVDIKLGPGVRELGGLFVLGTERHEARRIDNQLRGRSGRQGDPGESRFYVSLDDELMRLFGGEGMRRFMDRIWTDENEAIESKMLTKQIEKAQKRVERRNFEIRKHLLEYDNIMNEQRTEIYNLRDRILLAQDLEELLSDFLRKTIDAVKDVFFEGKNPLVWNLDDFKNWLRRRFNLVIEIPAESLRRYEQIREFVVEKFQDVLRGKFSGVPEEVKTGAMRWVMLSILDRKWKDHLYNIDELQEGIHLWSYAETNPLVMYRFHATEMFNDMITTMRREILEAVMRLEIEPVAEPIEIAKEEKEELASLSYRHDELGQFDRKAFASIEAERQARTEQEREVTTTIKRPPNARKLRPNDPCWCGSGKKYKYCHMKQDREEERRRMGIERVSRK